jgi:hypothetical protein
VRRRSLGTEHSREMLNFSQPRIIIWICISVAFQACDKDGVDY